jgi:hypothetical protein
MAQPRPWVEEVLDALGELGGEGKLEEIYEAVSKPNLQGAKLQSTQEQDRKQPEGRQCLGK